MTRRYLTRDERRREAEADYILGTRLAEADVLAFVGEPGGPHGYVVTLAEARAHAYATGRELVLTYPRGRRRGEVAAHVLADGTVLVWDGKELP